MAMSPAPTSTAIGPGLGLAAEGAVPGDDAAWLGDPGDAGKVGDVSSPKGRAKGRPTSSAYPIVMIAAATITTTANSDETSRRMDWAL
jgi:hypothetical protein